MKTMPLKYFNPFKEIRKTGSRLPHWEQPGACMSITFRLADSLPEQKLRRWREEREVWFGFNPKPWTERQETEYHQRFSRQIDRWLDSGEGSCVLGSTPVQERLADSLFDGQGEAFVLHSFVIMPNHVHLLTSFREGETLENRLKRWKGGSSRSINKVLGWRGVLWQKGYFDRLIRDADHFGNCVRYIRRNPEMARLPVGRFMLWQAEWIDDPREGVL